MQNVKIDTTDKRAYLTAPYDAAAVAAAHDLGGSWDGRNKRWSFDVRDVERVRELARTYWGTDGTEPEGDLVTVRIDAYAHETGNEIRFAGRRVAIRRGRDEPVKLSAGVVVVAGKLPSSAGSMKNPAVLEWGNEVTLEVRDLPRGALAVEADDSYTLVDDGQIDVDALHAEREKLLARLAEIDAMLSAV